VNRGTKPAMMMAAEKKMARFTSAASNRVCTTAVMPQITLRSRIDNPPAWNSGRHASHVSSGRSPRFSAEPTALHQ